MATSKIEKVTNESGIGYCKMPDGSLICYGSFRVSGGTATAWGTLYVRDIALTNVAFSVEFTAPPRVVVNCSDSSSGVVNNVRCDKTKITDISIIRQSATDYAKDYSYIAIGRWK